MAVEKHQENQTPECLPILNPNFHDYRDWPFANKLPKQGEFALPLDHYHETLDGWEFFHLRYMEVENPGSNLPTFKIRSVTESPNLPARWSNIHIIGTSDLLRFAQQLESIAHMVRNVGGTCANNLEWGCEEPDDQDF